MHVLPVFGDVELAKLTPAKVREWNAGMLKAGKPGKSTVAKGYRLLHAIMNTAVADELLVRNPCNIKGAGREDPDERPIVSVPKVYELADAVEPRFRAMVLIAAFVGLRLGEMMGGSAGTPLICCTGRSRLPSSTRSWRAASGCSVRRKRELACGPSPSRRC